MAAVGSLSMKNCCDRYVPNFVLGITVAHIFTWNIKVWDNQVVKTAVKLIEPDISIFK